MELSANLGFFKAVVEIRLYTLGNLGVKVEEEDSQAPGSPQADSCPFFPFSWVSLVRESVQVATHEDPLSPRSFFFFKREGYSDDVRLESESELEFEGSKGKHRYELLWDSLDCCSVFP